MKANGEELVYWNPIRYADIVECTSWTPSRKLNELSDRSLKQRKHPHQWLDISDDGYKEPESISATNRRKPRRMDAMDPQMLEEQRKYDVQRWTGIMRQAFRTEIWSERADRHSTNNIDSEVRVPRPPRPPSHHPSPSYHPATTQLPRSYHPNRPVVAGW